MSAALMTQLSLTDDELQVVRSRAGVEDFPTVLAVRPRHGDADALDGTIDQATLTLTARGLIADSAVDDDLAAMARALHHPERELAVRIVTPDGTTPVGAPLAAIAECLDEGDDASRLADRIYALGTERRAAMLLGSALSSRLAFVEIVYYTLASDEGRISRSPAAATVLYTKRGRIVAAPSASPAGELWTTLKTGSDHKITQAIGQLIGLSTERWEDT